MEESGYTGSPRGWRETELDVGGCLWTAKLLRRGVLAGALLVAQSVTSWAHPIVDGARASYQEGELSIALARLEEAEGDPNLTQQDRALLLWYRALCLHAQGKKDQAGAVFDQLIAMEPLYEPSRVDANPRMKALFQARVEAWRAEHGVTVAAPLLSGARVQVQLSGHAEEVASVVVFARVPGAASFRTFSLPVEGGRSEGPLSDDELWQQAGRAGALELVAEARNGREAAVARVGNALQPVRVEVSADDAARALEELHPAPPPQPEVDPLLPVSPPVVTTEKPVDAGADASSRVRPLGLGIAAVAGVGAGLALVVAVLSGLVAGGSYVGLVLYPPTLGGDARPEYNALVMGVAGGAGVLAVTLGVALLGALLAGGALVLSIAAG